MASVAGHDVAANVSKKTTILVVGIEDKSKLKGYEKNTKYREVEDLIEKGMEIQILSESAFAELIVGGLVSLPHQHGFLSAKISARAGWQRGEADADARMPNYVISANSP